MVGCQPTQSTLILLLHPGLENFFLGNLQICRVHKYQTPQPITFYYLLFLFSGFNFLLSTMYFSREILLTKTLEKNLLKIISSIVLRICMMNLYIKSYPASCVEKLSRQIIFSQAVWRIYASKLCEKLSKKVYWELHSKVVWWISYVKSWMMNLCKRIL